MKVKCLLQLLQKIENKDTNLQYIGTYGNAFPITEIEMENGRLMLITGSTNVLPLRKLIKFLVSINEDTLVVLKLEKSKYRCIKDILSSGSIKIFPITTFYNCFIANAARNYICSNCAYKRCVIMCSKAIHQCCDMYGFKLGL